MAEEFESAFDAARAVLARGRAEAAGKLSAEARKRRRIVLVALAAWVVVAVALVAAAGNDMLVVGELGLAAIIAWGVFWLFPTFVGRGNLDDVFDQYAARIDELDRAGADMPRCADMADIVAALDYVKAPDEAR